LMVDGQPAMTLQEGDFVLVPSMRDLVNESFNPPAAGTASTPMEIGGGYFRVGSLEGQVELRMRIGHCCRYGACTRRTKTRHADATGW
jgi:hypothetical protein